MADVATCLVGAQESVAAAVAARPDHFVRAASSGVEASEEMLDALARHYSLA